MSASLAVLNNGWLLGLSAEQTSIWPLAEEGRSSEAALSVDFDLLLFAESVTGWLSVSTLVRICVQAGSLQSARNHRSECLFGASTDSEFLGLKIMTYPLRGAFQNLQNCRGEIGYHFGPMAQGPSPVQTLIGIGATCNHGRNEPIG